jgi:hypothetical protein
MVNCLFFDVFLSVTPKFHWGFMTLMYMDLFND